MAEKVKILSILQSLFWILTGWPLTTNSKPSNWSPKSQLQDEVVVVVHEVDEDADSTVPHEAAGVDPQEEDGVVPEADSAVDTTRVTTKVGLQVGVVPVVDGEVLPEADGAVPHEAEEVPEADEDVEVQEAVAADEEALADVVDHSHIRLTVFSYILKFSIVKLLSTYLKLSPVL